MARHCIHPFSLVLIHSLNSSLIIMASFPCYFSPADINECEYDEVSKECAHGCINTVGSYRCAQEDELVHALQCPYGLMPTEDGQSCKGKCLARPVIFLLLLLLCSSRICGGTVPLRWSCAFARSFVWVCGTVRQAFVSFSVLFGFVVCLA